MWAPYVMVPPHILWFFFQNKSDFYLSRQRDIWPRNDISLVKKEKKPLNCQVEQHLGLLSSHICLEYVISAENFNLFREFVRWWHVQLSSYTCHHEVSLARVKSYNRIFFIMSPQTRKFRCYHVECVQHILWFARHTSIFFQNMSDGYMSRQRDI